MEILPGSRPSHSYCGKRERERERERESVCVCVSERVQIETYTHMRTLTYVRSNTSTRVYTSVRPLPAQPTNMPKQPTPNSRQTRLVVYFIMVCKNRTSHYLYKTFVHVLLKKKKKKDAINMRSQPRQKPCTSLKDCNPSETIHKIQILANDIEIGEEGGLRNFGQKSCTSPDNS